MVAETCVEAARRERELGSSAPILVDSERLLTAARPELLLVVTVLLLLALLEADSAGACRGELPAARSSARAALRELEAEGAGLEAEWCEEDVRGGAIGGSFLRRLEDLSWSDVEAAWLLDVAGFMGEDWEGWLEWVALGRREGCLEEGDEALWLSLEAW